MARSHTFKVGLLVIVATVLLLGTIAIIAGIRLREPVERYSIRFDESVSGLDPGSPVKYRGVKVGSVDEILIPPDDITKVEVWIAVAEGTPIKVDTKAKLSSVGITGLRFVDLIGGSPDVSPLPVGDRIEAETSLLESLSGRAATAAEKADVLLDNLLKLTSEEAYRDEVQELYKRLVVGLDNFNEMMVTMTGATTRLDTLLGRTNKILARNEEKIDRALSELEGTLTQAHKALVGVNEGDLVENLNATMEQARIVATDVRGIVSGGRRDMLETLANMREASSNLNDFSRIVRDQPSLLIRSRSPEPRRLPESD